MIVSLIVALGSEGEIGYKNKLPWHCANDMRHFKQVTTELGTGCVMGRNTWESLPPSKLPGRVCIVLSSLPIDDDRCVVVSDYSSAVKAGEALGLSKLFIIGGSRLFNERYNYCDELYITSIHQPVEQADTWFKPNIKLDRWRLAEQIEHADCTIGRWVRR